MTLPALDQWIALAMEWQPLLAGILAVVASIILAAGIVKAAKIRAGRSAVNSQKSETQDLRASAVQGPIDADTLESVTGNLENLRSLLRSALSSLSSVDADDKAARALCIRIAAFQWQQFPIPANADKRMQETYGAFLNQFEQLRKVLNQEWSGTEASAILIQLNANARTLIDAMEQRRPGRSRQSHSLKQH
ncbi:MAG TPA: hypothetical protein VGH23_05335 [Rhizomicrobium sp.]|jgi:hypothetical protein